MTRTNALESLVIAGFVRGLSVRDVEAALAEALGLEASISKSTVSRVCAAIKDEFDEFKRRDLSDIELEYLFLDGSHFKYHQGAKAEPVLVAWALCVNLPWGRSSCQIVELRGRGRNSPNGPPRSTTPSTRARNLAP